MPKIVWKEAYDGTACCLIDDVFDRNRGSKKNHASEEQDMVSENFHRFLFLVNDYPQNVIKLQIIIRNFYGTSN